MLFSAIYPASVLVDINTVNVCVCACACALVCVRACVPVCVCVCVCYQGMEYRRMSPAVVSSALESLEVRLTTYRFDNNAIIITDLMINY